MNTKPTEDQVKQLQSIRASIANWRRSLDTIDGMADDCMTWPMAAHNRLCGIDILLDNLKALGCRIEDGAKDHGARDYVEEEPQ
jgi:hypothetical protein